MDQLSFEGLEFQAAEPQPAAPQLERTGAPRFRPVDRSQCELRNFALEDLIEDTHPARAIWEFLDKVELTPFEREIRAVAGGPGQPTYQPKLLIALWLYAYSTGIGSAREVSRQCEHEPAFRWLCGDQPVNYHTLSDFRVKQQEALRGLLIEVLGVLSYQGLVKLERVAHDGTKVRAVASQQSLHREETLKKHLEEAKAQVESVEQEGEEAISRRQQAARRRAAEDKKRRLEEACQQLKEMQAEKSKASEKAEVRVSESEPEARHMKQEQKTALGYNLQVSTDGEAGIIVNAELTAQASDYPQLIPALEQLRENFGKLPDQVLADAGYMSRENLMELDGRTDLLGSYDEGQKRSAGQQRRRGISEEFGAQFFLYDPVENRFQCPVGKMLRLKRRRAGRGKVEYAYTAAASDCQQCPQKAKCCPQAKARSVSRIEEDPAIQRFCQKMKTPECQEQYKKRSQIAEFPFCWLKEKFQLRRFHVRGLAKAQCEAWWAVIAYNVQQWIRLRWKAPAMETAA